MMLKKIEIHGRNHESITIGEQANPGYLRVMVADSRSWGSILVNRQELEELATAINAFRLEAIGNE